MPDQPDTARRGRVRRPRAVPDAAPSGPATIERVMGERVMAQHRRRFIAPLLAGDWIDADADPDGDRQAATVVALDAVPAGLRLAALAGLARRVAPGGVLVLAAGGDAAALAGAVRARFRHVACLHQRRVAGSILVRASFAAARVVALADADAGSACDCVLLLCSDATLPTLSDGLHEGGFPDGLHEAPFSDGGGARTSPGRLPAHAPEIEDGATLRTRAAALVDRLAALDAERLDVFRAARAAGGQRRAGPWYEPQGATHAWPLHDGSVGRGDNATLYDRRTEDDFVAVARDGAQFMARFRLDRPDADFAGAVAAIAAIPAHPVGRPEASIVMPVHGQLGYTLNALHALALLADRTPREIVVVDDASPDETAAHLAALAWVRLIRLPENHGFVAACNAGVAAARGNLIVLLNNDTRVLPFWLDRLVESFVSFPRAGIVGSKLLYPDATLQEAGGILWRDGRAWNYGRGDDPNRPQYCFSRQVDYASGASLAIRKSVWDALGGFDLHFAPAYYEEGDLYFRARAAGYETWMQSGSRLIHYEGKTAGTDLDAGAKAFQRVNARKFRARHHVALLAHEPLGETPVLARDRVRRRRALLVEATVPTPKEDAGSQYTVALLRALVELGYSVTFVPQDNFLYRPGYTEVLMHMGVECVHAPYDLDFDGFMEREGARFDVAVVIRARVFAQVQASLRRWAPQAPLILDVCDLEHLRLARGAAVSGDAAASVEAEAVRGRELAAMAQADCILSPSSHEVGLIERALPDAAVFALPLMVDVVGTTAGPHGRRDLCFLGGYAHPPNVDAVAYFARDIMPMVRAGAAGTRFVIAGANPVPEVLALAGQDIAVTGFVDDLAPLLDTVRVFVCPLRYGAGMKGKILAAMAHGVPVVTTSVGIEGIAAEDGVDVLVADTPAAIAAACLRLLRDDALWRDFSARGIALIGALYSHASGRETLDRAIGRAFERWASAPQALQGTERPAELGE